jgi:hypothetical protein
MFGLAETHGKAVNHRGILPGSGVLHAQARDLRSRSAGQAALVGTACALHLPAATPEGAAHPHST